MNSTLSLFVINCVIRTTTYIKISFHPGVDTAGRLRSPGATKIGLRSTGFCQFRGLLEKMLGDQIFCWATRFFNLVVRVGNQILERVSTPVSPNSIDFHHVRFRVHHVRFIGLSFDIDAAEVMNNMIKINT